MAKKMDVSHIAGYLFIIGLIVAIIAGLYVGFEALQGSSRQAWISIVLIVLGVVIGTLMITSKKIEEEIYGILLVSLVLLVLSQFTPGIFSSLNTAVSNLGGALDCVVTNIAVFAGAAIIVLAVRTITHFHISKIR
jgi:uncharacterized membrane protein